MLEIKLHQDLGMYLWGIRYNFRIKILVFSYNDGSGDVDD